MRRRRLLVDDHLPAETRPRHKPKVPFGVLMSLHLTILRLATFTEHARAEPGV